MKTPRTHPRPAASRVRRAKAGVRGQKERTQATRDEKMQLYLRDLADRLGLKDWDVEFFPGETPEDPDAEADVVTTEHQHADIRVAECFWTKTPQAKRAVCVHEMCHLKCDLWLSVGDLISEALPDKTGAVIRVVMTDAEEHAVEAFARLLAPMMPLPKF